MSAAAAARVSRFYTAARRHPWVLGKVADWKIPLGPYTPAQIAVAVAGGFVLVKTISWWSWMGPLPIVAWVLAVWTMRRPRIAGRAPLQAAWGLLLLGRQPRGGRIGGRAARDRSPRPLVGGFTIESAPQPGTTTKAPSRAGRLPTARPTRPHPAAGSATGPRSAESLAAPAAAVPVSGVQQLLAYAQQGGAR
ncbi:hypothetical protein [Streptomyces chartreusis]|uniref:hypothetical protein n=1 Tax=Streptomyces chartreusis TaxID=1969 RepID=UPI00167C43E5|nr:hypothetical protein [Streptomyces chartreusis]GGX56155.1 hypothetical protein GCM10010321_86780 [Streptomyces chartreusis]